MVRHPQRPSQRMPTKTQTTDSMQYPSTSVTHFPFSSSWQSVTLSAESQALSSNPDPFFMHLFTVRTSTHHRARVAGQLPPRLVNVLRRVMQVPPTAGSE